MPHCATIGCDSSHPTTTTSAAKKPLDKWEVAAHKTMRVLEVLSLLALAAYSCYLLPELFIPFAGGGFLLGLCLQYRALKKNDSYINDRCKDSGGCSQDLMKQLTGVRLPAPLGLAANLVMTACHLEHHKEFLVPIVGGHFGFSAGAWAAQGIYSVANRKSNVTKTAIVAKSAEPLKPQVSVTGGSSSSEVRVTVASSLPSPLQSMPSNPHSPCLMHTQAPAPIT